jgi:site-specific recombinase XerD
MDNTPTATSHELTLRTALPADRHPVAVYLASLPSAHSKRNMARDLDTIAGVLTAGRCSAMTLDWSAVRYQHTAAIRAKLMETFKPATVNHALSALKGVLKECWRLGQMDAESYHRAIDLPSVKGTTLPAGRALSNGELRALFEACHNDMSRTGRRDAALLAVLCGGGLRRAEVVALDLADYDQESGALTVRGKGRKERIVYATNGAREALTAWLDERGDEDGPLFVRIPKGDRLTLDRMTDQAVLFILDRRREQAGVKAFSPHDLRRTFISTLWDAGADGATIQKLAGHSSITTTARYDRRGEEAKRKASEMIHVPYTG